MKKINRRTKVLILTVIMAIVFVAIYLFGIFIPEEAVAGSFLNAKKAPSWEHPFGTDALGRDLLMRTLKGLSVSITVGIAASVISAVIAVFVGIAAATGSKRLDAFINWCIDLVMGVPHTILVILISFALGRGLKGLLVGIASTHWCSLTTAVSTVCCCVPQVGKIQRLDFSSPFITASCAAVLCRFDFIVPSCCSSRSIDIIPWIRSASGAAGYRNNPV